MVTYVVAGLPIGLSIDATTGLVSGVPTTRQRTLVVVTASDTYKLGVAVGFRWLVRRVPRGADSGPGPGPSTARRAHH